MGSPRGEFRRRLSKRGESLTDAFDWRNEFLNEKRRKHERIRTLRAKERIWLF